MLKIILRNKIIDYIDLGILKTEACWVSYVRDGGGSMVKETGYRNGTLKEPISPDNLGLPESLNL